MSKINGKKVSKQNQIHHILDWDINNLVFADPVQGTVEGSSPPIKYFRVNILTKNQLYDEHGNVKRGANGVPLVGNTYGDLIFTFDKMFSFGVGESKSQETKAVTGHSMSFAMWDRDEATERQIKTTEKIEQIIQKCKEHLLSVRKELKQPKLELSDLKGMDKLLWWKTDEETQERVPGQGPTFSPKLIEQKEQVDKDGKLTKPYKMCTIFYHENEVDNKGEPLELNPLDFSTTPNTKKYCYVTPAIKFESIFFGAKISLQCKITEAEIQPVQMGTQRLLHRSKPLNLSYESKLLPTQEQQDQPEQPEESEQTEEPELKDEPVKPPTDKKKKTLKKPKSEE